MSEREIQFVTIAGIDIPAYKVICPACNALQLHTDFDTSVIPWKAICPKGHEFTVDPKPEA